MNDKDRYWDCLDQAMEASHGGHTEEALAWLEEALKARPGGAEAHNGRGEILWDEGKIHEALHELDLSTQADPKFLTAHLNRAELLIEEMGEYEQALEQCDRLLSGSPELARPDRGVEAEIYYLKAKALFYLDDLEGALFLVRRALKAGGEHGTYRAFEGQLCFELGRFEESRSLLEAASAIDAESAHAAYHLGLVLERLREEPAATESFARANALDPEHYPLPIQIDIEDFERVAALALDDLPRSIREYVENVPVLVEDFPARELIADQDLSPQILGLYQGVPLTEGGSTDQPQDLTRVILFKKNLEKICQDRDDLIEQIQITVRHEVGHHLGLSEEDLERLGLA
jgi:predicted Zn-dependent protease with MMP-like domain